VKVPDQRSEQMVYEVLFYVASINKVNAHVQVMSVHLSITRQIVITFDVKNFTLDALKRKVFFFKSYVTYSV
jgi:hypothetical protein